MTRILYSGQSIEVSDAVDLEALTAAILDTVAQGAHSWVTFETAHDNPKSVQLLVGAGIPLAIIREELEKQVQTSAGELSG